VGIIERGEANVTLAGASDSLTPFPVFLRAFFGCCSRRGYSVSGKTRTGSSLSAWKRELSKHARGEIR
jgi:hypothetical protein